VSMGKRPRRSGGTLEFIAHRNLSEPVKFLSFHAKRQGLRSLWHMKSCADHGKATLPSSWSLAAKPVAVSRPAAVFNSFDWQFLADFWQEKADRDHGRRNKNNWKQSQREALPEEIRNPKSELQ
jgi:hypothetical protein